MTCNQSAWAFAAGIPQFAGIEPSQILPMPGVTSLNNQVFRFRHAGDDFFLRLASDAGAHFGICRDEELAAMRAAATAGIAPPLVHANVHGDFICRYIHGRHWTREDFAQPANISRIGELVRTMHGITIERGLGVTMLDRIERMLANALRLGIEVPPGIAPALADRRCRQAAMGMPATALNHNDLWANNFLDDGSRLWVVDWEFAGTGDGLHDLNTIILSAGYADGLRQDFIRACGRDPGQVEDALTDHQYMVHVFEGLWAIVQHGLRGSAQADYLGMARSHFASIAQA